MRLDFSNDPALLRSEVARAFPAEIDNYDRLVARLVDYDDLNPSQAQISARTVLNEELRDPLLIEMLLCPLMFYGSAREDDMDWGQFSIMFRSVLLEGFARPLDGVRVILKQLTRRYKELGGELRLRTGVKENPGPRRPRDRRHHGQRRRDPGKANPQQRRLARDAAHVRHKQSR